MTRLRGVAFALLLALAFAWRLPTRSEEWRFIEIDPDSFFHLHRVMRCLLHYPYVESVDPFSHYPQGFRVHWLAPVTVFYASLARLLGLGHATLGTLGLALSWVPPILGSVSVVVGMAVARRCVDDARVAAAAGLLIALDADCCRPFFFGLIDHHLYGHLALGLLVLARLGRLRGMWLFGLVLFFAMTPEATFYVPIMMGSLAAAQILAGSLLETSGTRENRWIWFFGPGLVSFCVLVLHRLLQTDPLPLGDLSWFHLTVFQPIFLGLLGVALAAATQWVAPRRPSDTRGTSLPSLVWLVGSVAAIVWLVALVPNAFHQIYTTLLNTDRPFVDEETLAIGLWGTSAWIRVLSVFAALSVVRILVRARAGMSEDGWFIAIVLAVGLCLGLGLARFSYVVGSLRMVAVAVIAFEAARFLRTLPMFSRPAVRGLPAVAVFAVVVPAFAWTNVINRAASHGDPLGTLPIVEEIAQWLSTSTPSPAADEQPGASYGVFAPWSVGHQLHVLGRRPVVVDSFAYRYDAERELVDVLREFWWSKTADEFERALRHYGVRYFILLDPAAEVIGILGAQASRRAELIEVVPGHGIVFRPAMNQFVAFRLFMSRGFSTEAAHFEPRYFSREADVYGVGGFDGSSQARLRVPKAQVYELKPGVTISGKAAPPAVLVHYDVRWEGAGNESVVLNVPVDPAGRFHFTTALPAPVREHGFEIVGGYRFESRGREAGVEVSREMVDRGANIEIHWP